MSNFLLFIFFAFLGRHFPTSSTILLISKFYHYSGDLVIISRLIIGSFDFDKLYKIKYAICVFIYIIVVLNKKFFYAKNINFNYSYFQLNQLKIQCLTSQYSWYIWSFILALIKFLN